MDKIIVVTTGVILLIVTVIGIVVLSPWWISCWFCDKVENRIRLAWEQK